MFLTLSVGQSSSLGRDCPLWMWSMNHGVWCSFRCLGVHISQQWPSANHPGAFHSVLLAVSADSHWMDICPAVTDSSFCTVCLICAWTPLSECQCVLFFRADSAFLHTNCTANSCCLMSVELFWLLFLSFILNAIDHGGAVNVYWTSICRFRMALHNKNLKFKLAQLKFWELATPVVEKCSCTEIEEEPLKCSVCCRSCSTVKFFSRSSKQKKGKFWINNQVSNGPQFLLVRIESCVCFNNTSLE